MIIKLVKLIVLLSFFTLNIFSSIGQNESSKSEFYRISGKIQDAESGDMIQLAHIIIQELNIATISNHEGTFMIKIPKKYFPCKIYFSALGYKVVEKKLVSHDTEMIILMDQMDYILDEVEINPIDINKIIFSAIKKIPENYSMANSVSHAYYQEIYKGNDDYLRLQDYILRTFAPKENEKDSITIVSLKHRNKVDSELLREKENEYHMFSWGLSPYGIYNRYKDPQEVIQGLGFSPKKINKLEIEFQILNDGVDKEYYLIKFRDKKFRKREREGILVIDRESLAFIKVYYSYIPESPILARAIGVKPQKIESTLIYHNFNGKYQLFFSVGSSNLFIGKVSYNIQQSLLVTEYSVRLNQKPDSMLFLAKGSENISLSLGKGLNINAMDTLSYSNDSIWKEYNIIPPDKDLKDFLLK